MARQLPDYTEYDGVFGVGLPFDDPYWKPHRRHAARRRKLRDEMKHYFSDDELDRTFDEDYGRGVHWNKSHTTIFDPDKTKESVDELFAEVELNNQRDKLIDEFEKFLTKTNSDVPGRDQLRDKIRDYRTRRRQQTLKGMT